MIFTEVGAGTIGVSWTTLLTARGHDVVVTDPRGDRAEAAVLAARDVPHTPDGREETR